MKEEEEEEEVATYWHIELLVLEACAPDLFPPAVKERSDEA